MEGGYDDISSLEYILIIRFSHFIFYFNNGR